MEINGTDIETWQHLASEVESALNGSLRDAINMTNPDDREVSNNVAVRWAARYAREIEMQLDRTPTTAEIIEFLDDAYRTLNYHFGFTLDDVAAIQAYMMVIFGYDPINPDGDLFLDDDIDLDDE